MTKPKGPYLLLGVASKPEKKSVVLVALVAAEKLLNSVAYVTTPGDCDIVLKQVRKAITALSSSK